MELAVEQQAVALVVHGRPAPQGSKKGFATKTGKVAMVEMSRHVKPWREDVRAAALRVVASDPAGFPITGPLSVDMVFSIARPKGHYGTGRNAEILKPSAPRFPASMPDLSKLLRATEDALTSAGLWTDDARVVDYGRLAKIYVGSGDPDALPTPGVVIRIRALGVSA